MSDATTLAAAIADGQVAARDVMAASLARARAMPSAVVRLLPEDAALALADAHMHGPFSGLPFLGKDLGSAAQGLGVSAGVPALRARVTDPDVDSALFARFRAAGLIPFGLTSVPEFGLALTTEPRGIPPAANPFDPSRSAGGSSGGAALAVASGIVALAHATDAAGSIRVPAACCGLWGLKPSRGVVPMGPDFGNHLMGLVSELVVARSYRDVAAMFEAVTDLKVPDQPRAAQRIGLCVPPQVTAETRAAVERSADALAAQGHHIRQTNIPATLAHECARVTRAILSVSLADWVDGMGLQPPDITPIATAIAAEGRTITGTEVFALTRDVARLSHEARAMFTECDAILMPVLSGPPPRIGSFDDDATAVDDRFARMEALTPMASLANVAGFASVVFPAGFANDVPIGAQMLAPQGGDAGLLALASGLAHHSPIPFPHPIAGLPV